MIPALRPCLKSYYMVPRVVSLAAFRTAVRFLSKKSGDPHPLTSTDVEGAKEQRITPLESEKEPKTTQVSPTKYMSFDQLPKPSKELQDISLEQFNASLRMEEFESPPLQANDELLSDYRHNFKLSSKHLAPKNQKLLDKLKVSGSYTPNLTLLGIYQDTDTMVSGLEDHPLKESITGMCVLNPLLHEIKNKSLWEMFPEDKAFGSPPFGDKFHFNFFKEWEASKKDKLKEFESKKLAEEKEFQKFCKSLKKSKSFVRKTPTTSRPKVIQEVSGKPEVVETSGRKKLDRSLIKQYRKFRKEQLLKGLLNNKENK